MKRAVNSKAAFLFIKQAATHVSDGGKILTTVTSLLSVLGSPARRSGHSRSPAEPPSRATTASTPAQRSARTLDARTWRDSRGEIAGPGRALYPRGGQGAPAEAHLGQRHRTGPDGHPLRPSLPVLLVLNRSTWMQFYPAEEDAAVAFHKVGAPDPAPTRSADVGSVESSFRRPPHQDRGHCAARQGPSHRDARRPGLTSGRAQFLVSDGQWITGQTIFANVRAPCYRRRRRDLTRPLSLRRAATRPAERGGSRRVSKSGSRVE